MITITKPDTKYQNMIIQYSSFSLNSCCHADIFIDNHMKDNKELLLKIVIIGND